MVCSRCRASWVDPMRRPKVSHINVPPYPPLTGCDSGIAIADLAVKYDVQHLVYTGVDFAGQIPSPLPQ